MQKLFLISASVFISTATLASDAIHKAIEPIITNTMPRASVGIVVADAETGNIIYERNGFEAFSPASNAKLFSAAAMLYELGPDFCFSTKVLAEKKHIKNNTLSKDLYFKFSGDPSLKFDDIEQLIKATKKAGIHAIKGNVILDDSTFTKPYHGHGWSQDDLMWYYCPKVSAIMVNQNAFAINMTPSKTLGGVAQVSIANAPFKNLVTLKANVKTVTFEDSMKHCLFNIEADHSNNYTLSGCWPASNKSKYMKLAIAEPKVLLSKFIQQELKQQNIKLSGIVKTGLAPHHFDEIATHQSKPIKTLLYTMQKDSNNAYAESFTKMLGYQKYGIGSFQEGVNAIEEILHEKTDIDFSHIVLFDGSGSSRYDLVTPRHIVRLLYVIDHSPSIAALYKDTLPVSGKNGTLRTRLKAFDQIEHINAKTGTMTGVSTISGYMTTKKGKEIIFSIMLNHVVGDADTSRALQDKVLRVLYQI